MLTWLFKVINYRFSEASAATKVWGKTGGGGTAPPVPPPCYGPVFALAFLNFLGQENILIWLEAIRNGVSIEDFGGAPLPYLNFGCLESSYGKTSNQKIVYGGFFCVLYVAKL